MTPNPRSLLAWLSHELSALEAERAGLVEQAHAVRRELADEAPHPNHHLFVLGGIFGAIGFDERHTQAVHFWLWQPWPSALSAIADHAEPGQPAHLLRRLYNEIAAGSVLTRAAAEHARITGHVIPHEWSRERGKFGLGLPLRDVGLRAGDALALAGLCTVTVASLARRLSDVADGEEVPLVMLLPLAVQADTEYLARRGRRSEFLRARARYLDRCRSFAEFDANDLIKSWRRLPPTARQGHLILETARQLAVAAPHLKTRGEAADWLRLRGANLRYTKGDRE